MSEQEKNKKTEYRGCGNELCIRDNTFIRYIK